MAGDWIKMRTDLTDDPAVIAIAEATGLDEFAVVGRLHRLWSWANHQTVDGNAAGVTAAWVDRYLRTDGFAQAMAKAGWLILDDECVKIPNFERHNGKPAKQRALTANRVAKHKEKSNAKSNDDSVTAPLASAIPREEKSKEIPPTPQRGSRRDGFARITEPRAMPHDMGRMANGVSPGTPRQKSSPLDAPPTSRRSQRRFA